MFRKTQVRKTSLSVAALLWISLASGAVVPAVGGQQAPAPAPQEAPKTSKQVCPPPTGKGNGPQPPAAPQGPQPPSGPQAPGPQAPGTAPSKGKLESSPIIGDIEKLFTHKPEHFIVQSIVPGSGTGGGGQFVQDFDYDPWMRRISITGLATIRQFSMGEVQLRLAHNPFTPWPRPLSEQSKAVFHIYARTRKLPQMAFYGIGPNTNLNNQAFFSERDTLAGVDASNPLASWIELGGKIETIWNSAGVPSSALAQSITTLYPTTPGLAAQPNLFHYELSLHPHYPAQPPFIFDYMISYGFYQDHSTGQSSFRRLKFNLYNNFYPFHTTDVECKRITNKDIFFTLHSLIIASDTSAGHVVPFYLQPTLGGSDVNNDASLRGFKDYQFRGPDAILMQAEYNHRLWKYLGAYAFYDAGKVALHTGDLNFSNLRQSYGVGVSFWMNDLVLFKIYVGMGSGAGVHPYFGIPSFTGDNLVTGRGPTATPWD